MKSFLQFLEEEKTTYVVHGQAGGKFNKHEIEARSHDHAKSLYKKKMREMGHKYSSISTVHTHAEAEESRRKAQEWSDARDKKVAAAHAEMDKDKEYWADRQKDYDSHSYKGD